MMSQRDQAPKDAIITRKSRDRARLVIVRKENIDAAALAVARAAVDWACDTGDCHFCGGWDLRGVHDEDCPVGEYLEAGGGGSDP